MNKKLIIIVSVLVALLLVSIFVVYRLNRVSVAMSRLASADQKFVTSDAICYFFSIDETKCRGGNMSNINNSNSVGNNKEIELAKSGDFVLSGSFTNNKWDYILTGTLPNPCYSVRTDYTLQSGDITEGTKDEVTYSLVVIPPAEGKVCVDMIQNYEKKGQIEFEAKEDALFKLNIVTVSPKPNSDTVISKDLKIEPFEGEKYVVSFKYNAYRLDIDPLKQMDERVLVISYLDKASLDLTLWVEGGSGAAHIPLKEMVLIGKVNGYNIYRENNEIFKSKEVFTYFMRKPDNECTGFKDYDSISNEELTPPCFLDTIYPKLLTNAIIHIEEDLSNKEMSEVLALFDQVVKSLTIKAIK